MEQEGYINRTFLISPTAETNAIFNNLSTLDDDDVCTDPSQFQSALKDVMHQVKESMEQYNENQKYKKLYAKYAKGETLDAIEEAFLANKNFTEPVHIPKPRCLLICDDVQGTDLFTSKRTDTMLHLVIKHRHIPVSVIVMVQSFHGLPRAIRLNCTVYIVFATSDEKQLQQIYEHFGNFVTRDRFMAMYKYATSGCSRIPDDRYRSQDTRTEVSKRFQRTVDL
jgi:hypothetical protein